MNTPKRQKMYRRYKNLSGASKVARYEILKDSVNVKFTDGSVYRYTNQSSDPANISKMKELAHAGKGLGTFIETNLKERYLRKIK